MFKSDVKPQYLELAWRSGSVMDCHTMARGSIPGGNGVVTELHVFHKGQEIGVPYLNDLAVDGIRKTQQTKPKPQQTNPDVVNTFSLRAYYTSTARFRLM